VSWFDALPAMSPWSALDPLALWIARALLATLFAHAALSKLGDLALFEQQLAAYRVGPRLLGVATHALPLLEAAAALLLLSPWRAVGAVLAAALLVAYAAAMAWHRLHGRELDCGCGGEPLAVSWPLVARNALLAALAGVAAAPAAARTLGAADFAVVVAALLVGVLLYAAFHQVLRHAAQPSRRTARWMH
jgi:Methylamine utilisation protein MauE